MTINNILCQVFLETDPSSNIFQYNLYIANDEIGQSQYTLLVYYKNSAGHKIHNVLNNTCDICSFEGHTGPPVVIPINLGSFPTANQNSAQGQIFVINCDQFTTETDADSAYGNAQSTAPPIKKVKQLAYKPLVATPGKKGTKIPDKPNNQIPKTITVGNITFYTAVGTTKNGQIVVQKDKIAKKGAATKEKTSGKTTNWTERKTK